MNAKKLIPKTRRKRMTGLRIALLCVLCATGMAPGRAQTTTGIFSQQMFNKVNFNPAAVRPDPFFEAALLGRVQWLGFTDAPKTVMLNAAGYMPEIKSSVSGSVLGETFGRTFTLVAKVGYAYHVHLGRMNYLSFGLNADFVFKTLNKDAVVDNPNDPLVLTKAENSYKPDVDFGMVLTLRNFQLGLSATHLVAWAYNHYNPWNYFATRDSYYFFLQYSDPNKKRFAVDPYLCISYANDVVHLTSPDFKAQSTQDKFFDVFSMMKIDVALRFRALDVFWIGIGCRAGGYNPNEQLNVKVWEKVLDAAYIQAGVKLGKAFSLGYSYDFGLSSIRKKHTGSHEIALMLRFETTKKPAETSDTPLMFE